MNLAINATCIKRTFTANNISGSKTAYNINENVAINESRESAQNAAQNATIVWSNGTDSINVNNLIGRAENKNLEIGVPVSSYNSYMNQYQAVCSYTVRVNQSYLYQAHLTFELNGLDSSSITSANLKITGGTSNITYCVCAPKNSNVDIRNDTFYNYDDNSFSSIYKEFNISNNTTNVDITNQLKQCITTGKGVIVITPKNHYPASTNTMTPTFQLTYQSNVSKCTAPTTISSSQSIQKKNGTVSISWSGGKAGTNNAISGYTIYYRTGSIPTTTSYTDKENVNSSPYTFTVPSNASYGTIYYFKIVTRGAAGDSYNSDISSAQATVKVNTPPDAPTVSVDKTRFKSTSTSSNQDKREFTVTPGSDSDTTQSKTVRYATSSVTPTTNNTTEITSGTKLSLYQQTTYYFWTYDGLEFSSSYTSKTITKNVKPTVTSVTMRAYNNTTYTPSTRDGYVKNINGSAVVTKDGAATLTYQWQLCVGSGSNTESYENITNISTSTSLSNIDVTKYGAKFNTAYKLRLVVTDDLGESDEKDSDNVFAIPSVSQLATLLNYNNNTLPEPPPPTNQFNKTLKVQFNNQMTGITATLQWTTQGGTTWTSLSPIGGNGPTSVNNHYYLYDTSNGFINGNTYLFRINYKCNSITGNISFTRTKMQAIIPNLTILNTIKPYSTNNFPISFQYPAGYSGQYKVDLIKNQNSESIQGLTNIEASSVSANIDIRSLCGSDQKWKTLLGLNYMPNTKINDIQCKLTIVDPFGDVAVEDTKTFTGDFTDSLISTIPKIQIETDTNTYSDFPANDWNPFNRYTLFPNQKIRIKTDNNNNDKIELESYSDEPIICEIWKNSTKIQTFELNYSSSESENPRIKYKFEIDRQYILIINYPTIAENINYRIIYYQNSSNKIYLNNDYFKTPLCDPDNIIFNKIQLTENGSNGDFNITFEKQGGISLNSNQNIKYKFSVCEESQGEYQEFSEFIKDNDTFLQSNENTQSITNNYNSFYLGCQVTITNTFIPPSSGTMPTGETTITGNIIKNIYIYYNLVPNLLYGQNFFAINSREPKMNNNYIQCNSSSNFNKNYKYYYKNGNNYEYKNLTEDAFNQLRDQGNYYYKEPIGDQILTIRQTGNHTKIYIGDEGTEGVFEITSNGLVIDCGTW